MVPELEEHGAAACGLEEGSTVDSLDPCGAPSDGECKAALYGVEVCPFGEGELELVTERRAGGRSNKAEVLDFLQASCSLKRLSAGKWALESRAE